MKGLPDFEGHEQAQQDARDLIDSGYELDERLAADDREREYAPAPVLAPTD